LPGTYEPVDVSAFSSGQRRDFQAWQGLDTDTLLEAYAGSRNPKNLANAMPYDGWVVLRALLEQKLGPQAVSQIPVSPSGAREKQVGEKIGGVLKKAAPIGAAFIPGIGPLAAAGIAAGGYTAGKALEGTPLTKLKLRDVLASGAVGAGGNLAMGALRGGAPAAAAGEAAAASGGGGGIGGVIGGGLRSIGEFIKQDPLRAAQLGLAGVGLFQGAQAQGEADDLRRRAIGALEEPAREDLSGLFSAGTGNPYAAVQGPSVVGQARRVLKRGY
jgi:hypothetical protein